MMSAMLFLVVFFSFTRRSQKKHAGDKTRSPEIRGKREYGPQNQLWFCGPYFTVTALASCDA